MNDQGSVVKGLTVMKMLLGARCLIIRPEIAEFPKRCLFTNEPVDELTEMTLHEIAPKRTGVKIKELMRKIELPISPVWIEKQAKLKKMVGFGLLIAGITLLVAVAIVAVLPTSVVPRDVKMPIAGISGGLGLILTIIGIVWPRIKGRHSDPRAIGAWFITGTSDGDRIRIDGVHPEFLAQLPQES